jgi:hypothetical protein
MTSGFIRSLLARNSGRGSQVHPRMPSVFETAGRGAQSIIREETRTPVFTPHPDEIPLIEKGPVIPSIMRDPDEIRHIGYTSRENSPDMPLKTPKDDTTQTGIVSGNIPGTITQKPPHDKETNTPVNVRFSSAGERGPRMEEPRETKGIPDKPDRESRPALGAETLVFTEISLIKPSRMEKSSVSPDHDQEREISRRESYSREVKDFGRDNVQESTRGPPRQFPVPVIPEQGRPDSAAVRNPEIPRQRTEFTPVSIRSLRPSVQTREADGISANGTTTVKEPIVHVTIGRIEVRAVPPPVPRQKEQDPRALTRLDEYLKRRDEGDRR